MPETGLTLSFDCLLCARFAKQMEYEMAATVKAHKRRPWSREDLSTLKTSARRKIGARDIAKSLKRTEGATRQKAHALGISLDSR